MFEDLYFCFAISVFFLCYFYDWIRCAQISFVGCLWLVARNHRDWAALTSLADILGAGSGGRLLQDLCQRQVAAPVSGAARNTTPHDSIGPSLNPPPKKINPTDHHGCVFIDLVVIRAQWIRCTNPGIYYWKSNREDIKPAYRCKRGLLGNRY